MSNNKIITNKSMSVEFIIINNFVIFALLWIVVYT